jgi:hypothetical protein
MKEIKKKVSIKFYGSLQDFFKNKSSSKIEHKFLDSRSVKDLIESYNVPHTEVDVILVNNKSVDFSYLIKDGDSIKVYPPGYLSERTDVKRLYKQVRGEPKFICDVHLGTLARKLRKFGLDVRYDNSFSDETIAEISVKEKRIILTRDIGLLKRKEVRYGYFVRSEETDDQAKEILENFKLVKYIKPFTRCLDCGNKIKRISRKIVKTKLPDHTFEEGMIFFYCSNCDKIYWEGSHVLRMWEGLKFLLKSLS